MEQQLQIMLDLQNDMNTKVHSDWRQQNFAWYRAIWIECAEMLDHYGWKWWKKQTPDLEQVTLELIDIWHFGLSILLLDNVSAKSIARQLDEPLSQKTDNPQAQNQFAVELERFVEATLQSKKFSVRGFAQLMSSIELSFEQLYSGYIGKNVLNFFRQNNGYQSGSYQKLWQGREDNEHLVELAASLDHSALDYKDQLYQALNQRYREIL